MELEVRNLHFAYGSHKVICGFSFIAVSGENIYILGPNGVGKSTLFRCLMGHLKPSEGRVLINGRASEKYKSKELAKKIAYIPQSCDPSFNYTVEQMVAMGRTAHISVFSNPSQYDFEITAAVLERLGIEHLAKCGIMEISGGELQLSMIARALAQQADILLMDEPTSALDYGNQIRVQRLMRDIAHEGKIVIQSSHNPQYALFFADKVIAVSNGTVENDGIPEKVVTPELIQSLYELEAKVTDGILIPKK
jgi:iron complex transport system ATP-binding protein